LGARVALIGHKRLGNVAILQSAKKESVSANQIPTVEKIHVMRSN